MSITGKRTWTGTVQRPVDFIDFNGCECNGSQCVCPRKVRISLRTADGRTVVADLSPDEAEKFASQVSSSAAMARALS